MAVYLSSSLNKQVKEAVKEQIKNVNVTEIIEQMDADVAQALSNQDKIEYSHVKQAATGLLIIYEKFKNAKASTLEKMAKTIGPQNVVEELKKKQSQQSLKLVKIRNIYQNAINFDIILNAYLHGLKKQIIYVNNVNGRRELFQLDYQDLPKFITANKKISISTAQLKAEESYFINQTNQQMAAMDKIIDAFEKLFRENTVSYEKKKNHKTIEYKRIKQNQIVEFANGEKFSVLNIGDLNEAYAAMSLSKTENFKNISLRYFFENYLQNVDTTPSIIEEDVQGDSAQYGIKSLGGSAPGLAQFFTIALDIHKTEQSHTQDSLKARMKKILNSPGKRNKYITDALTDLVDIKWNE